MSWLAIVGKGIRLVVGAVAFYWFIWYATWSAVVIAQGYDDQYHWLFHETGLFGAITLAAVLMPTGDSYATRSKEM
jgi:hypothetical protein